MILSKLVDDYIRIHCLYFYPLCMFTFHNNINIKSQKDKDTNHFELSIICTNIKKLLLKCTLQSVSDTIKRESTRWVKRKKRNDVPQKRENTWHSNDTMSMFLIWFNMLYHEQWYLKINRFLYVICKDSHGIEESNAAPVTDTSQDAHVLEGFQNETHTSVTFIRNWQTCDPQDHRLTVNVNT